MIVEMTAKGTLPKLTTQQLVPLVEKVGDYALEEVQKNFGVGGRPAWLPLATGKPSFLHKSGDLLWSIHRQPAKVTGKDVSVKVSTGAYIPYAWVHQAGYRPRNIPPRPYMTLPQEVITRIQLMTLGYVTTILNEKGEPIV